MIPKNVQEVLDRHGLTALEFSPGSTPTSELAAAQIGVEVGQIAKSILMRGKDGKFRMFIMAGDQKISSSKVKRLTGYKHSMAGAEETREVTGFSPGAVCPFGVKGVEIYIDVGLKRFDTVYPAAGTDASGVPVSYRHLTEISGATEAEVGSDPR
ncbi:MAG TPA: YbaK/EbsC family protein [Sediminispirochaeta sp.]|nr:YbaK/EbsC family protein [Sediminispirochaeta sp.]